MGFLGFLKSRLFFKNTLIAIFVTIVLIWIILRLLNMYTRHGSYIVVADFKGVTMEQLDEFASDNDLDYIINDSLYDNSLPKGTVAMQDPEPGTKVKKNRKVYLTVVAIKPEQVSMPNLVDLTLRQATAMLETYGLKSGALTYVPDIAHNAILHQKFKGKEIITGTLIEKGSKIDLVIGKGEGEDGSSSTIVPDLYGKKQSQVFELLQEASLNVGNEIFLDGNDTVHAHVFKQKPEARSSVQFGGTIDLWYRSDKKFDFKNN
jgi:eukaryotic-like serine/threonine-protein kinase